MNAKQKLTFGVIIAVTAILIAYDLWVGLAWGGNYTESWVVLQLAHQYPFIPFAFGVLMGHLFASQHGDGTRNQS